MKAISMFLAAALGAAVIATPASAGQVRHVSYSDLNLTTAEGQATLQQRLNSAAWRVCQFRDDGMLNTAADQTACYRQARKDVAVRVAAITADVQRGG